MRIDKFLWCVRLYKARSLATEVCRKGRVRSGGEPVKPSRDVKVGDEFEIHDHGLVKRIRVLTLLGNRVGAKLVPLYIEDLSPEEANENLMLVHNRGFERRERGSGRPTKRDRRDIDRLKENQ